MSATLAAWLTQPSVVQLMLSYRALPAARVVRCAATSIVMIWTVRVTANCLLFEEGLDQSMSCTLTEHGTAQTPLCIQHCDAERLLGHRLPSNAQCAEGRAGCGRASFRAPQCNLCPKTVARVSEGQAQIRGSLAGASAAADALNMRIFGAKKTCAMQLEEGPHSSKPCCTELIRCSMRTWDERDILTDVGIAGD